MTAPPFVFNRKTGELTRGGKLVALCRLHADMFGVLALAQGPIGAPGIAKALNLPVHAIENEMPSLRQRLKLVFIRIASSPGVGKWLEFEEPPKWKPNIPDPVRLEGDVP